MPATEAPTKRRYTTELPDEVAERFESLIAKSRRTRPAEIQLAVEAWIEQQEKAAA